MSQGPLCPNLTQKVQKEVSQMANCNFSPVILLGGLSVNLNHLKIHCMHFDWLDVLFKSLSKNLRKIPLLTKYWITCFLDLSI